MSAVITDWGLVGDSAPMQMLRAQIARFAPSKLPVLIQGPTGSGKELVARAIHRESRRTGAFVAFNVCAVSEAMFEDALFGHVRGAFTGATADRAGYLGEANGGTILLDEIGSTGAASQSKLLRAIDTGSYRAVGAAMDRLSDFRLVAATNEDLKSLVEHGQFRRDLMHRLAGVVLQVPPLCSRLDDIVPLSRYFLERIQRPERLTLARLAARCLTSHDWPGNVRELKHTIERAALLADSGVVDREHIEHALLSAGRRVADEHDEPEPIERHELLRALLESEWDTSIAASRLGVHRSTVYRRMRSLGINSHEGSALLEARRA
jgi:DNA-binding NtrC family response regulator